MRRRPLLTGLILLGLLLLFFFLSLYSLARLSGVPMATGGEKVGVVPVVGVILDSREVIEQLKRFEEEGDIKALVIRINSPGGGVGPSQEIFREVERVSKKRVVASMGGVAASGGYYVALGAEKIFANPGTITGSIGVIMEFSNVEGLLKKLGLESYTIKSGKFKDTGSPLRQMTPEERKLLEGVVGDVHQQFVEAVVKKRKLSKEAVQKVADGRILTGRQAKELGLVDEIGNLEDAIAEAAKMAGIKGKPEVVYAKRTRFSLLEFLLGESPLTWLEKLKGDSYQLSYRLS